MINSLREFPPLLLLVAGCALVAPGILVNGSMPSRNMWTRGLCAIYLPHLLLSSLILAVVAPDGFGSWAIWHPIFLRPFFIAALPCIVFLPSTFLLSLNLFQTCLIIAINSLFWSLSVAGICFLIKRRQESGQRMQHMRIEAVIEKMKGGMALT